MESHLSDWCRLESVIKWANMTTNYFAREIGLSRSENLYQIKRGNNGISRKLAGAIVERFPQINATWLLSGEGDMFSTSSEMDGASIHFYDVDVELQARFVETLTPTSSIVMPRGCSADFAMRYFGRAMQGVTPPNSVVLLQKIAPEAIIPGDECLILTNKLVLLRSVHTNPEDEGSTLRLVAANSAEFDDVIVGLSDVECAYKVCAKIIMC